MDRAAFLRSLNFLRPLPPGVWDSSIGNNDDEPYSGSTITPPTPSKNNSMMLFEESLFAVSIEPNIIAESGHQQTYGRKRGRGDDLPTTRQKGLAVGPAFFQDHSTETIKNAPDDNATPAKTTKVQDVMDVEPENDVQQENVDAGETDLKLQIQINSDPSICTFEAAIMKKLPSGLGGEPVQDSVFATPNGHRQATSHEMDSMESKALIFRFGNRFVFQVDESAIVELKYQPGRDGGLSGRDNSHANTDDGDGKNESPPPKRQRNGGDSASHTDKVPVKAKKLPPSLIIAFGSCTFRVFSLEDKSDNNVGSNTATDTDRIWGTLAKTVESVESRIMKARSVLMQNFEIENKEKKKHSPSSWKMAPPGSGLAFHSWPDSLESSSFHSKTLMKYKASTFLEEDWSCCLGKNQTIPSTLTSPQKSSSPSKTSSSGTHFEHGQNEHTPTKNGSSQSHPTKNVDIGKNDNDEENDAPNHESELTHESERHGKDDGVQLKENQASLFEETGRNGKNSEAMNSKCDKENGKQSHKGGASQLGDDEKKTGLDGMDADSENTNSHSWKDGIYNKYHLFETSANHMERAMDPATLSTQNQQNGASMSHLTLCAESLSSSYLTANEFMNTSQQCENDIEDVTSEMERVLEKMFPARGRKSNAVASGQSEDFQERIEELMTLRKEAVAAKFALLMTPKR
mmetsp:Transcript_11464/g.21223  ORF Transcript_11464/g.21223 Transcript_11464/m.21223 type:complete len:687 (-) Transcript_11464:77-2137(-)|eukprot:CAMPEP_0201942516 /NCGR_PEP_ID=MMETSP0903-20130614/49170_1 /ASSEMBLY_ACC=CAM_ASM_000552 /TAXON_ID=420261 /ORGANISM="Thalassiosira antarctica, Strain CCMP982" /LENGTH=686 /DNA_ID=CAMNT_0048484927 /DNA_START=82 /DNA_END=2142 /DNA_ORIENTATION=+